MNIEFDCSSCGKHYSVGPQLAGKRVKCKACGNLFTVPSPGKSASAGSIAGQSVAGRSVAGRASVPAKPSPAYDDDDPMSALNALADLESSGAPPLPPPLAVPPPPMTIPPPPPTRRGTVYGRPAIVSPDVAVPAPLAYDRFTKAAGKRRGTQGDQILNEMREKWVPLVCIAGGLFALPTVAIYQAFKNPHGYPGSLFLMMSSFLILFLGLACTLASVGLRLGAKLLRGDVGPAFLTMVAVFGGTALTMTLGILLFFGAAAVGGFVQRGPMAVLGSLLGLFLFSVAVSYLLTWWLYGITALQALVGWLFAWIFGIVGMVPTIYIQSQVSEAIVQHIILPARQKELAALREGMESGDPPAFTPSYSSRPPAPTYTPPRYTPPAFNPPNNPVTPPTPLVPAPVPDAAQASRNLENFNELGAALRVYTNANGGKFPPDLQTLVSAQNLKPEVLSSPAGHAAIGQDYVYLGNPQLKFGDLFPATILAYDHAALEQGLPVAYLAADGSARTMPKAAFESVLAMSQGRIDAKLATLSSSATPPGPGGVAPPPGLVVPAAGGGIPTPPAPAAFWKVKPDPADPRRKVQGGVSLRVPANNGNPEAVFSNPASSCVMVINSFAGYVQSYDLNGGSLKGKIDGRLNSRDVALCPDGSCLVGYVRARGEDAFDTLEVWPFQPGPSPAKPLKRISLDPGINNVHLVGFVGTNTFITRTAKPQLQTWDLKTAQKLHEINLPGPMNTYALSPTGKCLAGLEGRNLYAYDLESGEKAGEQPLPEGFFTGRVMAFSPDGTELAALVTVSGAAQLLVWSVADGKVIETLNFPSNSSAHFASTMSWVPDKSGWLIEGVLVDRQAGRVAYKLPELSAGLLTGKPRRMLDNYRVLLECPPQNRNAFLAFQAVPLPKEELETAIKEARESAKKVKAGS